MKLIGLALFIPACGISGCQESTAGCAAFQPGAIGVSLIGSSVVDADPPKTSVLKSVQKCEAFIRWDDRPVKASYHQTRRLADGSVIYLFKTSVLDAEYAIQADGEGFVVQAGWVSTNY